MKIIMTGASGFVGQNLSAYLENCGNTVEKISLRDSSFEINNSAEAIIHLAGKAHDTSDTTLEKEYFEINTEMTKKIFDIFLKSEVRDFFFFSSVKATADTVEGILTEKHESSPQTAYGKSKFAAELYLRSKKLVPGKRLFIIRPCMIHGPGNKGNLTLLYQVVQKGIPWPLASFENERSFLSIDNLNFLILKMLKNEHIPSGIYNFADDLPMSTNALVKVIAKASGKKEKLWNINPLFIRKIAQFGNIFNLPLNSERLKKLTENYVVSNHKIKEALKINNLPIEAEEGMFKTIKSFKK